MSPYSRTSIDDLMDNEGGISKNPVKTLDQDMYVMFVSGPTLLIASGNKTKCLVCAGSLSKLKTTGLGMAVFACC